MPTILGPLSLIDLAVVVGIAAVLPLSFGGDLRLWLATAACAATALAQPAGDSLGVVLSIPLTAVVVGRFVDSARRLPMPPTLCDAGSLIARGFAVVAAVGLVASCAGWHAFGIHEPIVELTAVHFIYAGVGALVLAVTAVREGGASPTRLAQFGVILTATAPPVVAMGFITGHAAAQGGGAVLMSLGVWSTALAMLRRASQPGTAARERGLLVVSGLAVWLPMVLAVGWAAAQHWSVPALSIPDMVRTHGTINGLGFVIAGLVATAADRRGPSWS